MKNYKRQAANELREKLMATFSTAYRLRKRGLSLDGIIIDFDITMVGNDAPAFQLSLGRKTIKLASKAFDNGCTQTEAECAMLTWLKQMENEIFKEKGWN